MHQMSAYRMLGLLTWLITALGSIHLGLLAFKIDIFQSDFMQKMQGIVVPLHYVFGVAGIISLLMLLAALSKGDMCGCSCGK